MLTHTHTHTRNTHTHTHMHTHMYTYTQHTLNTPHTHTPTHRYKNMHTQTHIHTYTPIHTHPHTRRDQNILLDGAFKTLPCFDTLECLNNLARYFTRNNPRVFWISRVEQDHAMSTKYVEISTKLRGLYSRLCVGITPHYVYYYPRISIEHPRFTCKNIHARFTFLQSQSQLLMRRKRKHVCVTPWIRKK